MGRDGVVRGARGSRDALAAALRHYRYSKLRGISRGNNRSVSVRASSARSHRINTADPSSEGRRASQRRAESPSGEQREPRRKAGHDVTPILQERADDNESFSREADTIFDTHANARAGVKPGADASSQGYRHFKIASI